jgi:pimeloyl-ACP methyl ester carboxylesterase
MKKILVSAAVLIVLAACVFYFAFPERLYRISVALERKTAGLTEKQVQVGQFTICYLEGGQGETLLLLHGFGADKDSWNRLAKHLTPKFHVVAIDVPGFGMSSRPETESYTIRDQALRLDPIVAALGLDSFHLAGNSMGGAIAGRYAAEFPDKVRTLALVNTGGIANCPKKSELRKQLEEGKNSLLLETPEDFEKMLAFVFVRPPWIPGPVKAHLARQAIERRSFNEKVFRQIHAEGSDLEPELSRIRARTLILWGDQDRLIDVSCTEVLEKGLADSTTAILKDCGHAPMIERPEETARLYLGFLKMAP